MYCLYSWGPNVQARGGAQPPSAGPDVSVLCTPIRLIFCFLLLLTASCPQSFDVRMLSLLSHYWIPVLWWVNDATVAVMLNFFFSLNRVIMCKHLFCNELWLTIFCAHALFTVPTIWTMCLQ